MCEFNLIEFYNSFLLLPDDCVFISIESSFACDYCLWLGIRFVFYSLLFFFFFFVVFVPTWTYVYYQAQLKTVHGTLLNSNRKNNTKFQLIIQSNVDYVMTFSLLVSLSLCVLRISEPIFKQSVLRVYIYHTHKTQHISIAPNKQGFLVLLVFLFVLLCEQKKKIFLIRKYVFEYESNRRERDDTMWPTSMLLLRWIWKSNIFDGKIRFLSLFRLRILFRLFKKICFFFQLIKFSTRFWSEIAIFLISFFKRFVLLVNTHKNVDVLSTAAFQYVILTVSLFSFRLFIYQREKNHFKCVNVDNAENIKSKLGLSESRDKSDWKSIFIII